MDTKIVIDVTLGDRARSFDVKNRLQKSAYDKVMHSLDTCLSEADAFWRETKSLPGPNEELMRIHNAIFINGSRGAGKTAFMLNLKTAWQERSGINSSGLYFLNPIDPTLLDGTDSFVNVIVAHIYRIVSKHRCERPSDNFWKSFEKVAEALEAGSTFSDMFGAERVMATRDHAELELNLNLFFRAACEILSARALVILIDDVDMSLDWGFKVLEVVRRYLACPLVIPIISGDLMQYEVLVMSYFAKQLKIRAEMARLSWRDLQTQADCTDEKKNGLIIMVRSLATEYLKKVLPLHQRVRIKSIPELLEVQDTPVHVGHGSAEIELKEFLDRLAHALSFNANGVEGSRPPIEVDTARELVQLLQILHRHRCIPSDQADWSHMIWTTREQRRILADAMGEYWRNQNRPDLSIRAQADIQLLAPQPPMRLADVAFFDPRKHDQTTATYDLNAPADELLGRLTTPLAEIQYGKLPRSFMPMPAFEPISRNLFIKKEEWQECVEAGGDPKVRFSMNLYTYSGYYTSYQTAHLLFFGRAFEMIISHLFGRIDEDNLKNLFREPPYFSYFHFHPTQTINLGTGAMDTEEETDGDTGVERLETHQLIGDFERQWLGHVKEWYTQHPILAKSPPSAQLLYKVMNKFFNQINLYKAPPGNRTPVTGTLADQNQRLQLILMNAFASFESDRNAVALENFALGDLRHIRSANAWKLNIQPLLKSQSFTRAIFDHPLFAETSALATISITSASSRTSSQETKGAMERTALSKSEGNNLIDLAAKLSRGEKVRATNTLLNTLGDLRVGIWKTTRKDAAEIAEQIITLIRNDREQLSDHASTIAAQILGTGGYPGRIRLIMSWAGRLEEVVRLLLDMR